LWEVLIESDVVKSILVYAQGIHPREGILLLRGRIKGNSIMINDLWIPPQAVHGAGFSSFPIYRLPFDRSIIGTVHSHPSGSINPSTVDLNHFYGGIMAITCFPYASEKHIAFYNREGEQIPHRIIESE
jgi:proteasome lid subunit RPN8/RPN11